MRGVEKAVKRMKDGTQQRLQKIIDYEKYIILTLSMIALVLDSRRITRARRLNWSLSDLRPIRGWRRMRGL